MDVRGVTGDRRRQEEFGGVEGRMKKSLKGAVLTFDTSRPFLFRLPLPGNSVSIVRTDPFTKINTSKIDENKTHNIYSLDVQKLVDENEKKEKK